MSQACNSSHADVLVEFINRVYSDGLLKAIDRILERCRIEDAMMPKKSWAKGQEIVAPSAQEAKRSLSEICEELCPGVTARNADAFERDPARCAHGLLREGCDSPMCQPAVSARDVIAEKERLAIKEWVNEQMGDMQGIPMYGATSPDHFKYQRGFYAALKVVLDYLHSRDAVGAK